MSVDSENESASDPFPSGNYEPPSVDHTRVLEILASGGPLEDVLRELEVLPEDRNKYRLLKKDVEDLFRTKFKDCRVHAFGSTHTGLCMKGSDVDIFLEIDGAEEQFNDTTNAPLAKRLVCVSQHLMYQHEEIFSKIRPIPSAKTPIIKFVHVPTNVSCDISFNKTFGIANSDLIKHYIALDTRVYPYFMIIKYWAHRHYFCGCGKFTNYALTTLAAFYLQQLEPPVLPAVRRLQQLNERKEYMDGWLCSFNKDPNAIEPSKNTSSLFELLAGFFVYYDKLNIGDLVICPYLGKTIPKIYFLNTEKLPEPLKSSCNEKLTVGKAFNVIPDLCVQDPLQHNYNITESIGRRALINFQSCIRVAVEVCQEFHIADEKRNFMILSKLLSVLSEVEGIPALKLTESEMTLTISAVGFLSLALFPDVKKAFNVEIYGDGRIKPWFLIIQNLVITIFTKIMKFEVQLLEEGLAKKVRKMEISSDIHDSANAKKHQKLVVYVEGYYNMWDDRKKILKNMGDAIPRSHCLDIEETVSNELYKQRYATMSTNSPIVKFTCAFSCINDPPSVRMILRNKGTKKGQFSHVMIHLHSKLFLLIDKYCKYMNRKVRKQYRSANKS